MINKPVLYFCIILLAFILSLTSFNSLKPDRWTEKQLMEPSELAKILNDPSAKKPVIYNIGSSGTIKGAIEIGDGHEKENIDKLRTAAGKLPKNTFIVIYCGCCPFAKCPNIQPAFKALNDLKFTNHRMLNLTSNLKKDWIDKGYPIED